MATITALTPELLTKYKTLDNILYAEFENLDAELFKQLFIMLDEYRRIGNNEREIKFIETVFKNNLNINDKIKNYNTRLFDIFDNSYLTYDISKLLLLNINKYYKYNYYAILIIKDKITNNKIEKLINYCFRFDYININDNSEFIPLTQERLATFEANYAAKYENISQINIDNIVEYLKNNKPSNEDKQKIIAVLLA